MANDASVSTEDMEDLVSGNEKDSAPPGLEDEPKAKKKKKTKTSKDKNSPIKSAKDALDAIANLPSIDIDDLIDNLLKNTEDSVLQSADWRSVYQALASDDRNEDINKLIKDISSLDFVSSASQMERLNKYKDFLMIVKKLPIIKKILRIYTTNILSPDDITKVALKMVPKNPTVNKMSEEYISIENKYKVIMDKIDLERNLYNIVFKTLFYGDMFVEILSSKRYLLQTIYNLQIPLKDENIKLSEAKLDNMYDDSYQYNIYDENTREKMLTVNIEWMKPLDEQINETIDYSSMYFKALLNQARITENNLHSPKANGIIKYLAEELFGNTNILDNKDTFRAFNESYDSFMNSIDSNMNNNQNSHQNNLSNPHMVDFDQMYNNIKKNADGTDNTDKQYALDYLPTQATLSSLNVKFHTPDKIIVLKDEELDYGYLYVSGGIENAAAMGNNGSNGNSSMASNGVNNSAVISSSNFVNTANNGNRMGMFNSSGNSTNVKLNHAQQLSNKIATYIKEKFEEYSGDVNIDNMSPNLQMVIADILNKGSDTITIRYIPPLNMQQVKIEGTGFNEPYGESVVEDLLYRAKMLLADDVNNVIAKYTSTGKRLVWTVNANTHQQAANRIQHASRSISKKTVAVDNCIDTMASAIFPNYTVSLAA